MTAAAIILCAGKGTRMGSAPINKVCFDCAGVPVVKRIVKNMREGGVTRFVIVVGHRAESVMSALDGEPGVLFAYQKEQRGTGHAAGCGLRVLDEVGFAGSVVVSMGDKIVSPAAVRRLLVSRPVEGGAVLGVQPRPAGRTSKGHVVVRDGRALGIVEAKDVARALEARRALTVCGEEVPAEEVAATKFVNAAFYCFDARALGEKLKSLRADNAQGELYLTDTIESFAADGALATCVIDGPDELLTYSTRPELRALARRFLRPASAFRGAAAEAFIARFGDRPCVVASSPGRVNLMGRHVEHRGGSTNMMATAARLTLVVSPREDDVVSISNVDKSFPDAQFRISDYLAVPKSTAPAQTADWLNFLDEPKIKADLAATRGHWVNYVKSAVLRFQMATDMPLSGMDVMAAGEIPIAAGLSSSSAIVVALAEAIVALNELNLSTREFVDLCGEGEWFVGSRGGAGDHAAMKCSRVGFVTHLKFKPFEIGEAVPFSPDYAVVVVESGEQARKSEGARETFNARIRDYEDAFTTIRRHYPELPIVYFRDVAFLPAADRVKALSCLTGSVRGVAEFGVKECRRAEECLDLLKRGDYAALGEMMKASHDGDRLGMGEYECSTKRIDALCDRLNATEGVLGSQLVGAGLGGCVVALVARGRAEAVMAALSAEGYRAFVVSPSAGSGVAF